MSKTINVNGTEIVVVSNQNYDYISSTDIVRYKDSENTDDIIKNWLRNRNTIELLGFWEQLHNPDFKPVEFDGFRKQAGLNSFTMTPKNGLNQPMQLVLFPNPVDMAEPLPIKTLHLNLLRGFRLSLNFTSSRNFNASKKMRTTV